MPAWLIQLIVTLALQFGLPFVQKLFPKLPPEVIALIQALIEKLLGHKEEKKTLIQDTKKQIAACFGDNCPTK